MKVNSIRISNIFSFPYHDNIDDCDEIKFEGNFNIFIGPNGSGKSNFIEILNQLFKKIMIKNSYILDESKISDFNNYKTADLKATLHYQSIPHNLKTNIYNLSLVRTSCYLEIVMLISLN